MTKESKPETVAVILDVDKETPNTFRFKERESADGFPDRIGTIYVPKWVLHGMENPGTIEVTVAARHDLEPEQEEEQEAAAV